MYIFGIDNLTKLKKMKKVLLILAAAFIVSSAYSQFQVGPKFGMNFSKQAYHNYGSDVEQSEIDDVNADFRRKMGFGFGVMMNIGGDHIFNFQPEFMYINRGTGFEDGSYSSNKYIDVNLLFNLGKTTGSTWRAYGIIGPSFDYWLSKKSYDVDGGYISGSDKFYNNELGMVTDIRLDVSFVLGAGFKYRLGPGWITFSPRYQFGAIPQVVFEGSTGSIGATNNGFYLDFAYAFQFGGEEK